MTRTQYSCTECKTAHDSVGMAISCCDTTQFDTPEKSEKPMKDEWQDDIDEVIEEQKQAIMADDTTDSDTNELGQERWEAQVEEEMKDAEYHLERAIEVCESANQRGPLVMTYRDIVSFLFRHYDIQDMETEQ